MVFIQLEQKPCSYLKLYNSGSSLPSPDHNIGSQEFLHITDPPIQRVWNVHAALLQISAILSIYSAI